MFILKAYRSYSVFSMKLAGSIRIETLLNSGQFILVTDRSLFYKLFYFLVFQLTNSLISIFLLKTSSYCTQYNLVYPAIYYMYLHS